MFRVFSIPEKDIYKTDEVINFEHYDDFDDFQECHNFTEALHHYFRFVVMQRVSIMAGPFEVGCKWVEIATNNRKD